MRWSYTAMPLVCFLDMERDKLTFMYYLQLYTRNSAKRGHSNVTQMGIGGNTNTNVKVMDID
jgi:hypothetical protein